LLKQKTIVDPELNRSQHKSSSPLDFKLGALVALCFIVLLSGCEKETLPTPDAKNISGEEIGYFCRMLVVNHRGPKGQVHLRNTAEPLWFTSVRDTIAFTLMPGEPKSITAIYVNDMEQMSLDSLQPSSDWLNASEAWFVIDSDAIGGMGMPELVPFANETAASHFRAQHGGQLIRLTDIELSDVQ
tara:strand:+ start:8683 stop:9240 length:558 start_codon:yes stop_codon:yes gene_type:complete